VHGEFCLSFGERVELHRTEGVTLQRRAVAAAIDSAGRALDERPRAGNASEIQQTPSGNRVDDERLPVVLTGISEQDRGEVNDGLQTVRESLQIKGEAEVLSNIGDTLSVLRRWPPNEGEHFMIVTDQTTNEVTTDEPARACDKYPQLDLSFGVDQRA
jgi:hypothetical protein